MKKLLIVIGIFCSALLFEGCSSGMVGVGGTSYYGYASPYYRNPNPNFGYYGYGRPYYYQAPLYRPHVNNYYGSPYSHGYGRMNGAHRRF